MKKWVFVWLAMVLLCGCYDAREIDERDFVQTMAIDALPDGTLKVTLGISDDAGQMTSREGQGETLARAMAAQEAKQSRTIYYGHTKTIVLGEGLLKEERALKDVAQTLCTEQVLSLKTYVTAAEDAGKVVLALCEGESGTIDQFYQNNKGDWEETFPVYLKDLEEKAAEGATLLLPWVQVKEDGVLLSGCAVRSDGQYLGQLTGEETANLTWCGKEGSGRVVTFLVEGKPLSVRVNRRSAHVAQGEQMEVSIFVQGEVLQSGPFDLTDPTQEKLCLDAFSQTVTKQATEGLSALEEIGVKERKGVELAVKTDAVFSSAGMASSGVGQTEP